MIASLLGRISYFSKKLITHDIKKLAFDHDDDQKDEEGQRWNEVPADILEKIMQSLDVAHRVRMKTVCKSWQSLIDQNPFVLHGSTQAPWLMLPHCLKNNYFSFFDWCYGSIYNIKAPDSLESGWWWCCGSSKGWLVIMKDPYFNPQMFLFNPISRVQIPLPPLTTIPGFHTFLSHLKSPIKVRNFVIKIELSSIDASDCIAAGMFFKLDILALCRPGDKSWTIFQGMDGKTYQYSNILFSNNKVLHVLLDDEQAAFGVGTTTMRVRDRDVVLKIINHNIYIREQDWFPEDESEIVWTQRESLVAPYLVEYSNGELLIVYEVMNMMDVLLDDEDEDEDLNDDFDTYSLQVSRFEVFRIGDLCNNTSTVSRLNSLVDQTLFVGLAGSYSIQAGARDSKIGLQNNCIFFVDDTFEYQYSRESGIYYLKDESIKRSFPSIKKSLHNCRINWFSPNL